MINMTIKTYTLKIIIPEGVKFARDYGRKAQGMFLQCIKSANLELSKKLHSGVLKRPYSLTRLFRSPKYPGLLNFSVTIGDLQLQAAFQQYLFQKVSPTVIIDRQKCQVIETAITNHEFSSFTAPTVGTIVKLTIKTPLILSSQARQSKVDPLPLPERIWGNLWETWSDLIAPLNQEAKIKFLQAVKYQLSTPAFDIRTVSCIFGEGAKIPGLAGYLIYKVEKPDDLEALVPLAEFATIWGIGSKRARGYGSVIARTKLKRRYTEKTTSGDEY